MAKDNYTQLSNSEILDEIDNIGIGTMGLLRFLKHRNPELLQEIIGRTKFLSEDSNIIARLYCLRNNIQALPKCQRPNCNNTVVWGKDGFRSYCCLDCAYKDDAHWERRRKTMIEHHGVEHPAQSPKILKKMMDTCVERYGVEHPTQSSEIVERRRRNWTLELGVDHPMKLPELVEKRRLNNIERLGVESPFQLESVRNKYIETCMERYGEVNSSKSPEIRDKIRQGVKDSIPHSRKKFKSEKYPDVSFDSSWEFNVYDFLKEHGIDFDYQIEPIKYTYSGNTYMYIPDFRVAGKIYEVKGDVFFRINEETGKEEMYSPWRDEDTSDEEYAWECGRAEAKHQCMIANKVVILRRKDIENLSLNTFNL